MGTGTFECGSMSREVASEIGAVPTVEESFNVGDAGGTESRVGDVPEECGAPERGATASDVHEVVGGGRVCPGKLLDCNRPIV